MKHGKHLVWKIEGNAAKLLIMTFVLHSTSYLFYQAFHTIYGQELCVRTRTDSQQLKKNIGTFISSRTPAV
jgi:hypothetical protein